MLLDSDRWRDSRASPPIETDRNGVRIMAQNKKRFLAALLAVTLSGSAYGQVTPPAVPPPPTLWSFLGIPQGVKKVQGALTNRRGNLPALEPRDAIKALNDPANLESLNPAIKRAAEIKKAEDLKPQKIKAIKYLTSIGCGCYDKDGSITKALIAAAEDCTEDVRLETLTAVGEAATGKCCSNCGQVCCCNDDMLKKLAQIAYERDEYGCYSEPSKRVRDAATEALLACCPGQVPLEILAPEPKAPVVSPPDPIPVPELEQPEVEVVPEQEQPLLTPPVEALRTAPDSQPPPRPQPIEPVQSRRSNNLIQPERSSSNTDPNDITLKFSDRLRLRPVYPASQPSHTAEHTATEQWSRSVSPLSEASGPSEARVQAVSQPRSLPAGITRMRRMLAANPPQQSASANPQGGVVLAYDTASRTAYVHFEQADVVVPVGTAVHLRPDPSVANGYNGMWQVVESIAGCANLQPVGNEGIARVRAGDHANFGTPEVVVAPISYVR